MPTDMTDELTPYARGELFKPNEKKASGLGYVKKLLAPPCAVDLTISSRSAKIFSTTEGENPTIAQILEDHCPSLFGPKAIFTPAWALPTGDIQTIYQSYGPHTIKEDSYRYERRYIILPDGANLALDFTPAHGFDSGTRAKAPIVIVISGFMGGTHDGHIRETVMEMTKPTHLGGPEFRVVVMNMRGCNTRLTSPGVEHAARTDDIRSSVLYLTTKYPGSQLFALGFELGAGYVTNYLGETGVSSAISAGFVVSNMWDNRSCHAELGSAPLESVSRVIHNHGLGQKHRKLIAQNSDVFSALVHPPHTTFPVNSAGKPIPFAEQLKENINDILMDPFPTMTDITDRFIVPVSGFSETKDFLVSTSSEPQIEDVRVPLVCLNAADDTLFRKQYFPYDLVKKSQHVVLAVTEKGGHCGWLTTDGVEGSEDVYVTGLKRWFTKPIIEFFEAIRVTDPRPLPAPAALRPDSHGMVRCADDPAVGFKESSEQEILALPVSDKKIKPKPHPTGAMDVVVFFAWLSTVFWTAFEVLDTLNFTFKFVKDVVVKAVKADSRPNIEVQPPKQQGQDVVGEVGDTLNFAFDFVKDLVKNALKSKSAMEIKEQQQQQQQQKQSESVFSAMAEIPGTVSFAFDFVRDLIRNALKSKSFMEMKEQQQQQQSESIFSAMAEIPGTVNFAFDFVKDLVKDVLKSKSAMEIKEEQQQRQQSESIFSAMAEIPGTLDFVFDFLKDLVKNALKSKSAMQMREEQQQQNYATVVEVADALHFAFTFLKDVVKTACNTTLASEAEKQMKLQDRYVLVDGQWQKASPATLELVRPRQDVISTGIEVVDAIKFTFDFVKELVRLVINSDPPPKKLQTQQQQTIFSTVEEVGEALPFTFNCVKDIVQMSWRSTPRCVAQASLDRKMGKPQGFWAAAAEVVDAAWFAFEFVKGVIELAFRSNRATPSTDLGSEGTLTCKLMTEAEREKLREMVRRQKSGSTVSSTFIEAIHAVNGKPLGLPVVEAPPLMTEVLAAVLCGWNVLTEVFYEYWKDQTQVQRVDPRVTRMRRAQPLNM
ncbi:hypothetical protein FRB96_005864 [Tulasnella sp. 330]|nr:hypothetical protein FRB96_005864 [Tulasnella sp. 330]